MENKRNEIILKFVFLVIIVIISIFTVVSYEQNISSERVFETRLYTPVNYNTDSIKPFEFIEKDWEEKILSDDETEYDFYGDFWKVSLENDKVIISAAYDLFWGGSSSIWVRFDLDDGYFSNEIRGEIADKIYFMSNDGLINYTVADFPVKAIFSINDNIYFITRTVSYFKEEDDGGGGKLYKLSKINGKWEIEMKINLGGYPVIYMVDNSDIYIGMSISYDDTYDEEIIKISTENNDMRIQEIAKTIGLPASSMVKKDDMLYMGLDGSVATIDLKNNEIKFYIKK